MAPQTAIRSRSEAITRRIHDRMPVKNRKGRRRALGVRAEWPVTKILEMDEVDRASKMCARMIEVLAKAKDPESSASVSKYRERFVWARRETLQGGSVLARRGYLLVDRYSMATEGSSIMIGDLERGYVIAPISRQVRSRLEQAAKIKTAKIDGKTLATQGERLKL